MKSLMALAFGGGKDIESLVVPHHLVAKGLCDIVNRLLRVFEASKHGAYLSQLNGRAKSHMVSSWEAKIRGYFVRPHHFAVKRLCVEIVSFWRGRCSGTFTHTAHFP